MRPILLRSLGGLMLGLLLLMQGCASLPSVAGRPASSHLEPARDSRLGRAIIPLTEAHPDQSGVIPLKRGLDAFAARVLLADAAERSLDVQYYIWHDDLLGTLLLEALHARRRPRRAGETAARRRQHGRAWTMLAALDAHAEHRGAAVQPVRRSALAHRSDTSAISRALNRRMHNKSFTADNQATIIGGRNIGDEYFGAGDDALFVDLDVLAVGAGAGDVSSDFDRYWASVSAYPAERIVAREPRRGRADARRTRRQVDATPTRARTPRRSRTRSRQPARRTTAVRMGDNTHGQRRPAKGLGLATTDELQLLPQAAGSDRRPKQEFELVSPYFVPGERGHRGFRGDGPKRRAGAAS